MESYFFGLENIKKELISAYKVIQQKIIDIYVYNFLQYNFIFVSHTTVWAQSSLSIFAPKLSF